MKIMDSLLDREVHPQFKSPILANYYVCNGSRLTGNNNNVGQQPANAASANNNAAQPPLNPSLRYQDIVDRLRGMDVNGGPPGGGPPLHLPPPSHAERFGLNNYPQAVRAEFDREFNRQYRRLSEDRQQNGAGPSAQEIDEMVRNITRNLEPRLARNNNNDVRE